MYAPQRIDYPNFIFFVWFISLCAILQRVFCSGSVPSQPGAAAVSPSYISHYTISHLLTRIHLADQESVLRSYRVLTFSLLSYLHLKYALFMGVLTPVPPSLRVVHLPFVCSSDTPTPHMACAHVGDGVPIHSCTHITIQRALL